MNETYRVQYSGYGDNREWFVNGSLSGYTSDPENAIHMSEADAKKLAKEWNRDVARGHQAVPA